MARIEPERVHVLSDEPADADAAYVLYWMQQSQRAEHNPALEYAVDLADERGEPVLVGFGLDPDYPEANERSFAFLLEGLAETAATLAERGIKLVLRFGRPVDVALALARDASVVVCDRGYLRHQRQWRRTLAREAGRRVVCVEGDVVVPVEHASPKAEYAARTLRPKLEQRRDAFVRALSARTPRKASLPLHVTGDADAREPEAILRGLSIDREVPRVDGFRGGTSEARRRLTRFLRHDLTGYGQGRADPGDPQVSCLSPYLHFGQLAAVEVAAKVQRSEGAAADDRAAFLEELVVRRELAANFVWYTDDYDSYGCLPGWAQETLAEHEDDERPHRYTAAELERAETHDRAWNAAMTAMRRTGYLHNHMRMYWGKQVLAWCNTPRYAYRTLLALNNRWFLDGRDPSSYANVAWIFGLHDRAWQERPVFGKVRSMTAAGLERKFDVERFIERAAGD